MPILQLCQVAFGGAALVACAAALLSVIRRRRAVSFNLAVAGAFSLVFFLTIPDVGWQLIVMAALLIVTAAVLMPAGNERTRRELMDDLDVGDSTAARRLKR